MRWRLAIEASSPNWRRSLSRTSVGKRRFFSAWAGWVLDCQAKDDLGDWAKKAEWGIISQSDVGMGYVAALSRPCETMLTLGDFHLLL